MTSPLLPPSTPSSTSTSSFSSISTPSTTSFRFATPSSTSSSHSAQVTTEDRINSLKEEVERLRAQLGDKDPHKIVQKHIELLHTYNEIKDGTQALIGKYALMTNSTIKDVHEELELPLTD